MVAYTSTLPGAVSIQLHQGLRLHDRLPSRSRDASKPNRDPSRTKEIFTTKKPRKAPSPKLGSKPSDGNTRGRPRTPKRSPSSRPTTKTRKPNKLTISPETPKVLKGDHFPSPNSHENNPFPRRTTPKTYKAKRTPRSVTPVRPTPGSAFPKTTKPNAFRSKLPRPTSIPRPKNKNTPASTFKLLRSITPIQFQSRSLNIFPGILEKLGLPKQVDTTKLYETLGVEKESEAHTIKKAYHKLAMKHHPDKGGDEQIFKEISAAYEILSDPEKRQKYNKEGLEGFESGGVTFI